MAGDFQPLDEKFPIVGEDGRPTLYFIKWAQQRQIDIADGVTAEQALEIVTSHLIWGDITGTLSDQADLQAALDGKLSVVETSSYGPNTQQMVGDPTTENAAFSAGDVTKVSMASMNGGTLTNLGYASFNLDLKDFVGGASIGPIGFGSGSDRCVLVNYGSVTGWEFGSQPYVLDDKIFHEGILSFGAGLTYAGGVLSATGAAIAWGDITGTLSDQTDLQDALDDKASLTTGGDFLTAPTINGATIWTSDNFSPGTISRGSNWWGGYVVPASNFPTIVHGATAGNTDLVLTDDADLGLVVDSGALIAGENMRFAMKAAPDHSQGWYLTMHVHGRGWPLDTNNIGICLRNTVNLRSLNCAAQTSGAGMRFNLRGQSDTAFIANGLSGAYGDFQDFWLRLRWITATSTYEASFSFDGKNFNVFATRTKDTAFTAGVTPDQVGIGVYTNQLIANVRNYWYVDYWRQQQ